MSLSRLQLLAHRQLPHALTRRRKNGVRNRRRNARRARLADSSRRFSALDDMDFDFRRLIDAQHSVVRKVALLDATVLDRDFPKQRSCSAEDHSTLDLGFDRPRVHSHPAVDSAHNTVHGHLAILYRYLRHRAYVAAERVQHRYATALPLRQRLAPPRSMRNNFEHIRRAR